MFSMLFNFSNIFGLWVRFSMPDFSLPLSCLLPTEASVELATTLTVIKETRTAHFCHILSWNFYNKLLLEPIKFSWTNPSNFLAKMPRTIFGFLKFLAQKDRRTKVSNLADFPNLTLFGNKCYEYDQCFKNTFSHQS